MSRSNFVCLVIGFALAWGVSLLSASKQPVVIAASNHAVDSTLAKLATDSAVADSSHIAQLHHDAMANEKTKIAEAVQLGVVAHRIPAVCLTPSAPKDSSVVMVPLSDAMKWKDAWEAERTARLHAVRVLIPDMEQQLRSAYAVIDEQSHGIQLRDAQIRTLERRHRLALGTGVLATGGLLLLLLVVR